MQTEENRKVGRKVQLMRSIQLNGRRLAELRDAKKWTQATLATKAGCDERTIRTSERGKAILRSNAVNIAQALGVSLTDIERAPLQFGVSFLNGATAEDRRLLRLSFNCYTELFPDEGERDAPEDIEAWLREAHQAEDNGCPWRETYGVLHVDDLVAGMAFVSGHIQRPYLFGNYFGVLRGYRQDNRAIKFLRNDVMPYLQRIFRDAQDNDATVPPVDIKGILFEIDPVDFDYLERIASRKTLRGHDDESRLIANLRSLQRLCFYDYSGARPLLGPNGRPMPYWQPAMSYPLTEDKERQLILMIYPFKSIRNAEHDAEEIVNFLYDDLFGDAYDDNGPAPIAGFRTYIENLKSRVRVKMHGAAVSRLALSREIRGLLDRGEDEGLIGEL